MDEEDDVLVVNGRVREQQKGETCAPDDRFFSDAQRCYAILEPSACDAFRACEQTILHRCVL